MSDARALLDSGDIAGLMRCLQVNAESMELVEVANLMEAAAAISGFDDVREAALALALAQGPQQLHDFGYACLGRGVSFLATLAFRRALEMMPGEPTLLINLVNALQEENRHAEALAVLEPHVGSMDPWPARYLLAYSALFAGEVARAEREAGRLPTPDGDWLPARGRLARMITRARAAQAVSPLDDRDLRGWHFALSGGLLITISPFGFDEGMNGRFGFVSDTFASCRSSLDHLQQILAATRCQPASVALLPDRSSRILGLAAAQVLELPAEPFVPGRADVLVVAYDLNEAKPPGLWARADGQVLFEHASCWTARRVSADVTGFLHEVVTSPWAERLRVSPNREVETIPPDERPEEELAAEIVRAAPQSVDNEESAQDLDAALLRLAKAVGSQWLNGPRDPVFSLGPVASNRFP